MDWQYRALRTFLSGFFLVLLCFTSGVVANPIPVQPHPQPGFPGFGSTLRVTSVWIGVIFIIDFFLDTLLLYTGVLLLERFHLLPYHQVFEMSKIKFFSAVFLISIVGLFSEWILGIWVWGLFVSLCFIFLSFFFVSRYVFRFTWMNAIRMGGFATIMNILAWVVFFTIW